MSTRDLTYIGVFAALWGAIEISLGTYLHAIGFPLTGLVVSTIGLGLALTATSALVALGLFVLAHLVAGAVAGFLAHLVADSALRRLRAEPAAPEAEDER